MAPAIVLYFAARWLAKPSYRPFFLERLGRLPKSFTRTRSGSIWLHAVSVGEVVSAVPLLRELRAKFPDVPLYLSVSTTAGRKAAQRQAQALVDSVFFAPIDFASYVRRTLAAIRPALLIVLETEIWPNLYFETVRSGARLVIVNGRISNRTWPQYEAWRWFFQPVLQFPDMVFVQSQTDFDRYRALGVREERLAIAGTLKYDAACATLPVSIQTFEASKIWVAASTVGPNEAGSFKRHFVDEDDLVLDVFEKLAEEFSGLLLILAPRQPERFDVVAQKLQSRSLSFVRRSATVEAKRTLVLPGVVLLDTIGELAGLYPLADVVFVGGSIAPRGGHNILEPAAAASAIVTGTNMQNFESIARDFSEAQAFLQVNDESQLLSTLRDLLHNPSKSAQMADRARALVERRRGVSRYLAAKLEPVYYSASLCRPRSALSRALLTPLAYLWEQGGKIKRGRSEQKAASLIPIPVPVISVGGITVGGSGKTPFVNYLAGALRKRGMSPAILTRGYRRRYPADHLIFAPGAKVSPFFTGDEPQIFLRAGIAPVGIGARRYETARILLRQFPETDVVLLDDGFQHALMARDLDIVLIDGLDPFGHEELVPLGRLREPLAALQRAGIFVVTRANNDGLFAAISERLRSYNASAPIYRMKLESRGWHDYSSGEVLPSLAGKKVGAFCGLGNPQSFWDTLGSQDLDVVFQWTFGDHHLYTLVELTRLAHQAKLRGAEILVTTEKDRINCPAGLEQALAPLALAWLEIALKPDREAELLDAIVALI